MFNTTYQKKIYVSYINYKAKAGLPVPAFILSVLNLLILKFLSVVQEEILHSL